MQLTEEQIEEKQEIFFTIINDFIEENYEVDENYIMTEEDAYIFSIIYEYFDENFKFPTLQEQALEEITGYDINTELYEELAEVLLDETVGTFVAGVAHSLRHFIANRSVKKTTAQKNKTKKTFDQFRTSKTGNKMKHDVMQKQHNATNYGNGPIGTLKKNFNQNRIDMVKKRADTAKKAMQDAEARRKAAVGKQQYHKNQSKQLANKIDTGIENVKNRTKQAISIGASRVGGILGKAYGAIQRV